MSGNSQTGRAVLNKKQTVNFIPHLDILALQRAGVFNTGPLTRWTMNIHHGDTAMGAISFWLDNSSDIRYLRFQYTIADRFHGDKISLNYQIPVVSTSCYLGGNRWWFICPLESNGKNCGRRCRILYLPYGAKYFGCRECYGLTYECRQAHRNRSYEGFFKPAKQILAIRNRAHGPMSVNVFLKRYKKIKEASQKIENYCKANDAMKKRCGQ